MTTSEIETRMEMIYDAIEYNIENSFDYDEVMQMRHERDALYLKLIAQIGRNGAAFSYKNAIKQADKLNR